MIISNKILGLFTGMVIYLLLLAAGCAQLEIESPKPDIGLQPPKIEEQQAVITAVEKPIKPEEPKSQAEPADVVTLALKFTEKDSTTYKLTTEIEKSIEFEGPTPDEAAFESGRNVKRIETTFTQSIEGVKDNGNAIAKITLQGLKQYTEIKNNIVLDFDSSRAKDKNNPLAKLIGQSYTIEITPTGQAANVVYMDLEAKAAVEGDSPANKAALALLDEGVIKRHHSILSLPYSEKNKLRPGENWTNVKNLSFGLMGSKSYEKIYTLKKIENTNGRQIAVVEMNAIPSSEIAELYGEQTESDFSKMFDNSETYTGRLKLDLNTGKIEEYFEKLQSAWVTTGPLNEQKDDKEPIVMTMSITLLHSLEKID